MFIFSMSAIELTFLLNAYSLIAFTSNSYNLGLKKAIDVAENIILYAALSVLKYFCVIDCVWQSFPGLCETDMLTGLPDLYDRCMISTL